MTKLTQLDSGSMLCLDSMNYLLGPDQLTLPYLGDPSALLCVSIDNSMIGFLEHTSYGRLVNKVLHSALIGDSHFLLRYGTAAIVKALGLVHSFLKSITLPTKHIVGVGAITTGSAFEAPHEWVRSAGSPHAIELGRVPDRFEGNLRYTNRVSRWAFRRIGEAL